MLNQVLLAIAALQARALAQSCPSLAAPYPVPLYQMVTRRD